MATTVAKSSKLSLKIMYDKKSKRVLFAKADKEAVDFLFYIMSLPLTTVTRLLSKSEMGMIGSLNNLYQSIENLDKIYFLDDVNKDFLLNPIQTFSVQAPLLLPDNANLTGYLIYSCPTHQSHCSISCSISSMTECQRINCSNKMSSYHGQLKSLAGNSSGIVKGLVKYIVMDNLVVKPISPVSSICLLKDLIDVKDLGNVDEIVVDLGLEEGLKMLKASLEGESVLTSVFLHKLG